MARTKVDGGPIARVAGAFNGLRGATMTATTTKKNLTVAVGNPPTGKYQCVEVDVQNEPGTQTYLYLGDSRYQEYALASGSNKVLKVNDLSMVYVRTTSGTAKVNLLISE